VIDNWLYCHQWSCYLQLPTVSTTCCVIHCSLLIAPAAVNVVWTRYRNHQSNLVSRMRQQHNGTRALGGNSLHKLVEPLVCESFHSDWWSPPPVACCHIDHHSIPMRVARGHHWPSSWRHRSRAGDCWVDRIVEENEPWTRMVIGGEEREGEGRQRERESSEQTAANSDSGQLVAGVITWSRRVVSSSMSSLLLPLYVWSLRIQSVVIACRDDGLVYTWIQRMQGPTHPFPSSQLPDQAGGPLAFTRSDSSSSKQPL